MAKRVKKIESAIVWRGTSFIDNAPLVAIITGMDGSSDNPKTGPMAQLWILRSDVDPVTAIKTGMDRSVCGDCGFRGRIIDSILDNGDLEQILSGRGCYVVVNNAPRSIFEKFASGGYSEMTP